MKGALHTLCKDLEGLTLFSQMEIIKPPCLVHVQLILLLPQRLLLSLNCMYLLFVTMLVRKSVFEPETVMVTELETAIVTEPETGTVTRVEIAIVTEAETAIVTESKIVPETMLVTEPVNVFVIVIETGSLAPGLRFENPVRLLLSLICMYLLFVTVLMRKFVIEPETVMVTELETAIVTEPETGTMTGVEIAIMTEAETAIVTESKTVPETMLVTEPVNVFVIVIETRSLAPGLRFENPVV
nr:hypothetical protein [Tanacetum cinerariifolium]